MSRDEKGSVSAQSMFSQAEVLHLTLTQRELTLKVFSNSQHQAQI